MTAIIVVPTPVKARARAIVLPVALLSVIAVALPVRVAVLLPVRAAVLVGVVRGVLPVRVGALRRVLAAVLRRVREAVQVAATLPARALARRDAQADAKLLLLATVSAVRICVCSIALTDAIIIVKPRVS